MQVQYVYHCCLCLIFDQKTEKLKLTFEGLNRPVCNLFGLTRVSFCRNCISPSNSEANRDGADVESPFPLCFSFSASFKNSSPREKVGNCLRFWDWWVESLFLSIIVAKYLNIFPHGNNGHSREKNSGQAICTIWFFQHAYVY